MCGVVGALVFDGSSFFVTESYLSQMRDAMAHRGPDGSGIWINQNRRVGLGHRRLSIIDLSDSASQPMSNEDGSLWISFNGEIYNHGEIRSQLEITGHHKWKTDHSDTEVILHAFEEWGIDCLYRFRGMFAIALWDNKKRELWLIRDRIGIKPLYYSIHHNRLTFASEIKALLQDPYQKREVDEEALFHYLSFLTTPAPMTLFSGIKKMSAGTWLRVKETGEILEHRYYDIWDHTTPLYTMNENDVAANILQELRMAVKLRKVSDVPVGVFLSGGIDSSTNAVLFSEGESSPVKTFTIGYDRDYSTYKNELVYARKIAHQVRADYHERILAIDDLLNFLPLMIHLQDEPIADPVCIPIYYLSKLARDNNVTVCQVGEGADELFYGYPGWKRILELERLNDLPVPRVFKKLALGSMEFMGMDQKTYFEWLRRAVNGLPVFWGGAEAFTENQKRELLSPRLRSKFSTVSSWDVLEPIWSRFQSKAWSKTHLNWMSYLDLNIRLPELLLMRVDKMSMGVSLEGRVPFLDHRFVEFSMSIPEQMKTKGGILKYILKKAVRDVIPQDIINRKKQGFVVPVHDWFFDQLGTKTKEVLQAFCKETDFLDTGAVNQWMDRGRGSQAWYLLNLALWHEKYIVS
jgi:asparagine synthase (glutamine-hydrolysing)